MKVAIYRSAVPAKTKNQFKRDLLTNFALGVSASGDEAIVVDSHEVVAADIAVLQGWIGFKSAPHLDLRKQVIDFQRQRGQHVVVIDSNLFGFLEPADFNRYLRYSVNGIFPTTGYYFDSQIDPGRWQEIKDNYSFAEHKWQKNLNGSILICLQRDGGWSMGGVKVIDWLSNLLPKIRQHSQRPIVVRGHPGSLKTLVEVTARFPDVEISRNEDIRQDFDRAWCTVTYNSSPGVASLLYGIPVIVTDPVPQRSQAWPWASTDLAMIEQPWRPDRTEFYNKISQCHFATRSLSNGRAWQFMRQRLPT